MYKRRDAKKRRELEKAQGNEYDRKTRKWVKRSTNAEGEVVFRPFHRSEGVLKEILRMDEQEDWRPYEIKWIFLFHVCRKASFHIWLEAENSNYYHYLVDLADEEFNMDLIAPPYSIMPAPITVDGRLHRERVKQTLIRAEIEANLAEGGETISLMK